MSTLKTLTLNGVQYKVATPIPTDSITLLASAWKGESGSYYQTVTVGGITSRTKIDLQPTPEQLEEFHYKVLAFVAENNNGTVKVYAIGDKPTGNYSIQITKTEIEGTGPVRGNTVGTTMPRPDWNQDDPSSADYIHNKPYVPVLYDDVVGTNVWSSKKITEEISKVDRSAGVVCDITGEIITVTDASDRPLNGLTLYGKTTQFTTTGMQAANLPDTNAFTSAGITFSCKNGVVTAKGTSTGTATTVNNLKHRIPSGSTGTYFVSGNAGGVNIYVYIARSDGKTEYISNKSFTLDGTETNAYMYLQVASGKTVDTKVYPMLNFGDTALPFEPFTGYLPSPSTRYPQELVNVGASGSVNMKVAGKNMFPKASAGVLTKSGITLTSNGDGSYRAKGTATSEVTLQFPLEEGVVLEEGMYLHCMNNVSSDISFVYWYSDYTSSYWALIPTNRISAPTKNFGKTITQIGINMKSGNTVDVTFSPMFMFSDKAMDFVPYQSIQKLTASTPSGLPGIPVSSGGNYTDANGQQWVCDEIDFARGVYVRRIGLINGYAGESVPGPFMSTTGGLTTGAKVLYALATPIETALSADELSAFASLHTNKPNTTVFNDGGAEMKLSYVADTKTYIDNKFNELATALVNNT